MTNVPKDLNSIKQRTENIDKIVDNLLNMIKEDVPRMLVFKSGVKTHFSSLKQTSNLKYTEILAETTQYYRKKRGNLNGNGTV